MPNVKPGDLAKVTHDNDGRNVGRMVLVKERFCPNPAKSAEVRAERLLGALWDCEALEHIWAEKYCGAAEVELLPPGSLLVVADAHLRRVDPPADTREIYSEEPLEGEKRDATETA